MRKDGAAQIEAGERLRGESNADQALGINHADLGRDSGGETGHDPIAARDRHFLTPQVRSPAAVTWALPARSLTDGTVGGSAVQASC